MEFRKKGVFLDQAKEPALSRPIAHYVFPKMVYLRLPQRAVFQRGDQVRIDEPAFTVGNQAVFSPIDAEVEDILTPSFDKEPVSYTHLTGSAARFKKNENKEK